MQTFVTGTNLAPHVGKTILIEGSDCCWYVEGPIEPDFTVRGAKFDRYPSMEECLPCHRYTVLRWRIMEVNGSVVVVSGTVTNNVLVGLVPYIPDEGFSGTLVLQVECRNNATQHFKWVTIDIWSHTNGADPVVHVFDEEYTNVCDDLLTFEQQDSLCSRLVNSYMWEYTPPPGPTPPGPTPPGPTPPDPNPGGCMSPEPNEVPPGNGEGYWYCQDSMWWWWWEWCDNCDDEEDECFTATEWRINTQQGALPSGSGFIHNNTLVGMLPSVSLDANAIGGETYILEVSCPNGAPANEGAWANIGQLSINPGETGLWQAVYGNPCGDGENCPDRELFVVGGQGGASIGNPIIVNEDDFEEFTFE